MKPTVLYIKQHSVTGLKYFGKTTSKNPIKYLGSGVRWTAHIKKHGKEHVKTLWISEPFNNIQLINEFAMLISTEFNIVDSVEWANLVIENGIDGGVAGRKLTAEHILKRSQSQTGAKRSLETRKRISEGQLGKKLSVESIAKRTKSRIGLIISPLAGIKRSNTIASKSAEEKRKIGEKISAKLKGKRKSVQHVANAALGFKQSPLKTCTYCGYIGKGGGMQKWHFDNCRYKCI